jgi:protoporphyrinogen oxidase
MDKPAKVAVIGAGLSGLVAALELLKKDVDVTLIEKSHSVGGRACTTVKDGFHLNLGPHALYSAGAAFKYLKENNIKFIGAPPSSKTSFIVLDGRLLEMSPWSLFTTSLLSLREKLELLMLTSQIPKLDLKRLSSTSFSDWTKKSIRTRKLRDIVSGFVRLSTYSNNLDLLAASAGLKQLILATKGVLYLDHGWQTLVSALHEQCKDKPDKFHELLGTEVTSITALQSGVEIIAGEHSLQFDSAIVALPPKAVSHLIPSASEQLNAIVHSNAACLDVCLKQLPNPDNGFAIGADEPLYFSVHSNAANLVDGAGALIHVATYLRNGEVGGAKHESRMHELLDQLQPGWQKQVIYKRFLPNMSASFGTAGTSGSNGIPTPVLNSIPHVYAAGDWVGAGAMLADAATQIAISAAQLSVETLRSSANHSYVAKA